jgi:hypothetical protein
LKNIQKVARNKTFINENDAILFKAILELPEEA